MCYLELTRERTESEEREAMRLKRVYSRDDLITHHHGLPNKKAMQLMGDVLLSSDKALRLLGDDKEADLRVKNSKASLVSKIRPNMGKLLAISIFNKSQAKRLVYSPPHFSLVAVLLTLYCSL